MHFKTFGASPPGEPSNHQLNCFAHTFRPRWNYLECSHASQIDSPRPHFCNVQCLHSCLLPTPHTFRPLTPRLLKLASRDFLLHLDAVLSSSPIPSGALPKPLPLKGRPQTTTTSPDCPTHSHHFMHSPSPQGLPSDFPPAQASASGVCAV